MKIINKISLAELREMADTMYGILVKADVDVARKIVIIDMEMHADGEAELLKNGSRQEDVWGINLHPDNYGHEDFIEYDSMINIRPRQQNPTRDVSDESVREKIRDIVAGVVYE